MRSLWSLYREVLSILPPRAQRFLIFYSVSLSLLSVLDALALALLAIVIGPVVSGMTLTLPVVGDVNEVGVIILLGTVCALIIVKGAIAIALLWRATRRFATYELELGARLFDSFVSATWVERLKRNSADLVRLSDSSVSTTISGFVLPASTLVGELLSFITVLAVLAVAQPLVAGIALVYLGLIGAVLFFWVTKRSRQAGLVSLRYAIRTSRLITEMVGALKEITLRNKVGEIGTVVRVNRFHTTRARSNAQFLGQVPRYVLESGIIGGFVLVGLAGFFTGGLMGATSAVALFGLAGFRMAPSIVRFQSVVSQMTVSAPHARAVITEIRTSEAASSQVSDQPALPIPPNPGRIRLDDVSFRYTPDAADVLDRVTLEIPFGSSVAFVGASGAGKSTIVDLVLGLMNPTRGSISIDETPLEDLTMAWRSEVGYVPQDVSLFDASVAQNVALSWSADVNRELVRDALSQAQMLSTIESRPGGIDAPIGERGLALSGGQRQRLGIARALYTKPLVLVMDEATSALDTATEAAVTDAVRTLRGSVTLITVAHRLATIRYADTIFFMSEGRIAARGTFDELVRSMPEFAAQARLAGLHGSFDLD